MSASFVPESPRLNTVETFLVLRRTLDPGEEKVNVLEYLWVRLVTPDWEYTERVK